MGEQFRAKRATTLALALALAKGRNDVSTTDIGRPIGAGAGDAVCAGRHGRHKFQSVQVTGAQAAACHAYLQRGSKVLVSGRLTPDPASGGPRLYQRSDGTMGASYEVRADQVRFLNDKPQEEI